MFQGYIYLREGSTYGIIHSDNLFLGESLSRTKPIEIFDSTWHKGIIKYSAKKGGKFFKTINGEDIILFSSLSTWH